MLPIEIEVVSGPPLEELFAQEGEEVRFLVADRSGEKKFLAVKIVSIQLDGVVTILFGGDSYRGTLFEGLYDSKLCCRGRLLFQSRPGMG